MVKMTELGPPGRTGHEAVFSFSDNKTGLQAFVAGRGIEQLGGRCVTAHDSGTSVRVMDVPRRMTPFARGLAMPTGKACPAAAYGTFMAIQADMANRFGTNVLNRRRMAVQGLGESGVRLCIYLAEAGAKLVVAGGAKINWLRPVWARRCISAAFFRCRTTSPMRAA